MEWLLAHAEALAGLVTVLGAGFAGLARLQRAIAHSMDSHFATKRDVQILAHKIDHLQRVVLALAVEKQAEVRSVHKHP